MHNHSVSQAHCRWEFGPIPGNSNQVPAARDMGAAAGNGNATSICLAASCWEPGTPAVCSPAAVAEWRLGVQQVQQLPGVLHGYTGALHVRHRVIKVIRLLFQCIAKSVRHPTRMPYSVSVLHENHQVNWPTMMPPIVSCLSCQLLHSWALLAWTANV